MYAEREMSNHSIQLVGFHDINCCRVDFEIWSLEESIALRFGIVIYSIEDTFFPVSWVVRGSRRSINNLIQSSTSRFWQMEVQQNGHFICIRHVEYDPGQFPSAH